MDEIVLRLDRQTASDLLQFLYDAGEHISQAYHWYSYRPKPTSASLLCTSP
jgi:hypothetical protein